jgi:RNA polymerase sigma-70 factor (ECF subfamily)
MLDFQTLVDAHYTALYRFALSLVRNEADACDLTQQTFFQWASKGHQLRDAAKVKSWLFTALYREFLAQNRRTSKFQSVELSALAESGQELEASPYEHSSTLDGQTVIAALREIDELYRAPITLFYLEEFSYREIAEVLEVPIGTVMSRLSRGKALLRERLETPVTNLINIPIPTKKEANP